MPLRNFDGRARAKIEHCKSLVYESYYKSSVIDKIMQTRDANESDENFQKMYKRTYIPEEWFVKENVYPDLVFKQFGSGIATSEKKYIIEEILKNDEIQRSTSDTINFETIREKLLSFSRNGIRPTVMLAPIEYFTKLHTDWRQSPHLRIVTFHDIAISGQHYRVFWSNKYVPFEEFVFVDKSFGEWISKPNYSERLSVTISESDKEGQLDLLIFTTLKFRIMDTTKITILQKARS